MITAHSQRLIVVVGPSGAGKDSVLRAWLSALPPAGRPHLARRSITRPAGDATEAHEAFTPSAFAEALAAEAFAFAWQAHGLHYGIRWRELAALEGGGWVVMNGSREHLPVLRQAAPQARVVAVVAGEALRQARLLSRERETPAHAHSRLARSVPDREADLVLHNDGELAAAVGRLAAWWRTCAEEAGR